MSARGWWFGSLLLLGGVAPGGGTDPVFDVPAILAPPLNGRTVKATEKDGIVTEEVRFFAERDGDQEVELFAFFAYPKGGKGLPAFVWNQGGLYQASPYFPELGAKRGYAVLCIDFPIPGYRSTGGYPINSGLELGADPRRAPIYHGAVALLRAVSYLASRPEVDRERIGMAGSSWGGFFTTLMAGLDPRLKAASSMYGCGTVQLGNAWWDGRGWDAGRDPAFRERWRTTLDPAFRLPQTPTPIAWFTGTADQFYWLPAVMASHAAAGGPKHLGLLANWQHALTETLDEQVFAWLDVHLKGAPPFLAVTPVEVVPEGGGRVARWKYAGPRRFARAELLVSYGAAGNWTSRYWLTLPAEARDVACRAALPDAPLPCFVSGTVVDADGFRSSTPLLAVAAGKGEALPAYDGCAEWGGFEPAQITYLRRHGFPVPPLRPDAKEGKQAAALPAGPTVLAPIFFTAGVPHRFTCAVKADRPAEITVQLGGDFDGKPQRQEQRFRVGTDWTELSLPFTPPPALVCGLRPTLTLPADTTILLDAVRFTPVAAGAR
jgi:dienelactone hydrolase